MTERILWSIVSAALRPFVWWQRRRERRKERKVIEAMLRRGGPG
jgi:hypothetical protein